MLLGICLKPALMWCGGLSSSCLHCICLYSLIMYFYMIHNSFIFLSVSCYTFIILCVHCCAWFVCHNACLSCNDALPLQYSESNLPLEWMVVWPRMTSWCKWFPPLLANLWKDQCPPISLFWVLLSWQGWELVSDNFWHMYQRDSQARYSMEIFLYSVYSLASPPSLFSLPWQRRLDVWNWEGIMLKWHGLPTGNTYLNFS